MAQSLDPSPAQAPGSPALPLYPFTFGSLSTFGQVQCVKVPVHLSILLPWKRRVVGTEGYIHEGQVYRGLGTKNTLAEMLCPQSKEAGWPRTWVAVEPSNSLTSWVPRPRLSSG